MKLTSGYEELNPKGLQKSFYGKAKTFTYSNGLKVLYSYDVAIVAQDVDGLLYRLWDGDAFWSHTTAKHIVAFCGLNKKDFLKLPLVHTDARRPHTWFVLEYCDYLESARLQEVLKTKAA